MSSTAFNFLPIINCSFFKVYVQTCTYNQAEFIEDCLTGVSMQKTDFPFIHHVIDDASTDGEQDVIKDWIERECDLDTVEYHDNEVCMITIAKKKGNSNCTLVVYFLKKNMFGNPEKSQLYYPWLNRCEFIALCEGDDYWTDFLKLQKQVNIFKSGQNVQMVYTDYSTVGVNGEELYREGYEKVCKPCSKSGDILPDLFIRNFPMTLTVMYRTSLFKCDYVERAPFRLDYSFCLAASFYGNCVYLPFKTAAYRNNPNSLMNTKSNLIESIVVEIQKYYAIEYIKGLPRKVSLKNHIGIMRTIILRHYTDTVFIKKICSIKKEVCVWLILFGIKRFAYCFLKKYMNLKNE